MLPCPPKKGHTRFPLIPKGHFRIKSLSIQNKLRQLNQITHCQALDYVGKTGIKPLCEKDALQKRPNNFCAKNLGNPALVHLGSIQLSPSKPMGIHIDPHLSKLRHGLPGFHHESEAHETTLRKHPKKSLQPYHTPQKRDEICSLGVIIVVGNCHQIILKGSVWIVNLGFHGLTFQDKKSPKEWQSRWWLSDPPQKIWDNLESPQIKNEKKTCWKHHWAEVHCSISMNLQLAVFLRLATWIDWTHGNWIDLTIANDTPGAPPLPQKKPPGCYSTEGLQNHEKCGRRIDSWEDKLMDWGTTGCHVISNKLLSKNPATSPTSRGQNVSSN